MDDLRKSKHHGQFSLAPGVQLYGELTVAGRRTSLYLYDRQYFKTYVMPHQYIMGVLHDLSKVSLIDCLMPPIPGHGSRRGEEYYSARAFPHFVIHGDQYLAPDERSIDRVDCVLDDAPTLFYDFDAFGMLLGAKKARSFIDEIAAFNGSVLGRQIETGLEPEILYFCGKRNIFSVKTRIGQISASHNPAPIPFDGPSGVGLRNTIFLSLEFPEPVIFERSMRHIATLSRFFELLVGRPQNFVKISLSTKSEKQNRNLFTVYWSMPPRRKRLHRAQKPHPSDLLLDAVRQPDHFCRVLANWLERDESWAHARARLSTCVAKQSLYDVDRLVGAANMFDILPACAVPSDVPVARELEEAKKIGRAAFLSLPSSPERDGVLSALGRIGKASLKQKVRYRAASIVEEIGNCFPDLLAVTNEAVNCRNFYVHGGVAGFDYEAHFDSVIFFTETLEFVFAASDLIEAGWDVKAWTNVATTMSHPFARYRMNYGLQLHELGKLLKW